MGFENFSTPDNDVSNVQNLSPVHEQAKCRSRSIFLGICTILVQNVLLGWVYIVVTPLLKDKQINLSIRRALVIVLKF